MKLTTPLASGLTLIALTLAPFGFAPAAQASSVSRALYGPNGSAERSVVWGANGAADCASGVHTGGGFAGGCSSA
jgi:hypothetical protein